MVNIVSLSGGKDSVALWLWALRTGLDPVAVYVDTGWEWDGHHRHLNLLEARIGPIHRIGPVETFEAATRRKKSFPSRVRKWCTEELKLKPFRSWLDTYRERTGKDVTVLLGIRRDESPSRANATEREWSDFYDCEVWRPILDWTVEQVIAEHRRAAIPMHPLYHHGAERVGCFPCVNASKAELEIVARLAPDRIDRIRALEAEMGATMFTRDRRTEKAKLGDDGPSVVPVGIDEVIEWARTDRGGRQFSLVRMPTGCARWGVCEAPPREP
jgi:3'-phosphoadenosine 5'-phosphosulfate sulfotransferase (PAPS reductase)/FAD synthetase